MTKIEFSLFLPILFFETNFTTKLTSLSAPLYGLSATTLAVSGENFVDTVGANRSLFQKCVTRPLSTTDIFRYICPFRPSCSCIVWSEHLRRLRDNISCPPLSSSFSPFDRHNDNSTCPFLFSFWNNIASYNILIKLNRCKEHTNSKQHTAYHKEKYQYF